MYRNRSFPEKCFFHFQGKISQKNNPWPTQHQVFISTKCQGFSLGLVLLDLSVAFGTIVHRLFVPIEAYTLVLAFEFKHLNTLNISLQIQVLYNKNLSQVYNNLDVDVIQDSIVCPLFSFYVQSVLIRAHRLIIPARYTIPV